MDAVSTQLPTTRRWHRRVAWFALFAACTFALTGLLHPLMVRLQPQPAQRVPPPVAAAELPPPAAALAAAGIPEVAGLRPVRDAHGTWWRVQTVDGGVRYLEAATGVAAVGDAERAHAERLARWYAGEADAAVADMAQVTAFDADYGYTNRLLPVWRVAFARDDGLTVYVSTADDRLATISDTRKRVFQQAFRLLHSWAWLPSPLRNGWINLLMAAVATTTLLGLTLAVRRRGGRRWTLRRLHRWGGIAVAATLLCWSFSGVVQAWGNAARERADAPQRPLRIAATQLTAPLQPPPAASGGVTLVTLAGQPVWRWALQPPEPTTGRGLAMGEHHARDHRPEGAAAPSAATYVSARDGAVLAGGEARHLDELIAYFRLQGAAAAAIPVLRFDADYGFLFKRLPVWKVAPDDAAHSAYYLDTASERLAATVTDGDRRTGALFSYLHKWEWVTPWAGKDWRDVLTSVFTALVLAVALGGTWLRRRALSRTMPPCH